jgi:hypothetical protein
MVKSLVCYHFANKEPNRFPWKQEDLDFRLPILIHCTYLYIFKVLFVESVDVQLDSSMTEFLNHNLKFDSKSQLLVIPELLHFYQDYVLLNQEPESHTAVPAFTGIYLLYQFQVVELLIYY